MTTTDIEVDPKAAATKRGRGESARGAAHWRGSIAPILLTIGALALAAPLGWASWGAYMGTPWTRDASVRVYVVKMAPEIAGRIVELPVTDNQFVRKGDLLMTIDQTDYKIAVKLAEAVAQQARADAQNLEREAKRRQELSSLAVTEEVQQTYAANAIAAEAKYQQAEANLDQARVNLGRAQIRSPVNGYVTNLLARLGDYANVGQSKLSVIDADSFWIDGYFEETYLNAIHEGDPAKIKLLGQDQILRGHVGSVARGIDVPNAQPDQSGLASVNPIFTWVRLAQRIPVRIQIDETPDDVRLVAGMTATVQIDGITKPKSRKSSPSGRAPQSD